MPRPLRRHVFHLHAADYANRTADAAGAPVAMLHAIDVDNRSRSEAMRMINSVATLMMDSMARVIDEIEEGKVG